MKKIWNAIKIFWQWLGCPGKTIIYFALCLLIIFAGYKIFSDNPLEPPDLKRGEKLLVYKVDGSPPGAVSPPRIRLNQGEVLVITHKKGSLFEKLHTPVTSPQPISNSDYFSLELPGGKRVRLYSRGPTTTVKVQELGDVVISDEHYSATGYDVATAIKDGNEWQLAPMYFTYKIVKEDRYQGAFFPPSEMIAKSTKTTTDKTSFLDKYKIEKIPRDFDLEKEAKKGLEYLLEEKEKELSQLQKINTTKL